MTNAAEAGRSWDGFARAARRRGAFGRCELATLSMLPFLDVLFSAIGVFLLVITLQDRVGESPSRLPTGDILLVADPDGRIRWVRRDGDRFATAHIATIGPTLRSLVADLKRQIRIVAAFGPDAVPRHRELQAQLDQLATRTGPGSEPPGIGFSLIWLPLDGEGNAAERLLEQWREAVAGREVRPTASGRAGTP